MTSYKGEYSSVENDPLETRIYTLKNGLKVYLTQNTEEPRIQTFIAVKAGFKHDPDNATGLAHYLEHMMFKGSDKLGTLDWEMEKSFLDQIEKLYEDHRNTDDEEEKRNLYLEIDRLSGEAAKYAVPNEYDKLVSAIGAKNTNAYTSFDQTVYMNEIPCNELERWLAIESERFRTLVLRLFHTELETVYEEFNMRNQDSDNIKVFDALFDGLFTNHFYGRQPSIGKPQHLKNPSMKEVYRFFDKYYKPSNMALCLSGDLDPEQTMHLVEKYFGTLPPGEREHYTFGKEPEDLQPMEREVWGNEAENISLAFRFDGASSFDALILKVINGILFNRRAGLVDLNLNQKQAVLQAFTYLFRLEDYSILLFNAYPKENQPLEDLELLLLEQINQLKEGNFDEWLIEAVVNDLKLQRVNSFESNSGRAEAFVDSFTHSIPWEQYIREVDELEKITKKDIVDFVRGKFLSNYVIVKKMQGPDPNLINIDKPPITPVVLNRNVKSHFFSEIIEKNTPALTPEYLDFEKDIEKTHFLEELDFYYVQNNLNDTFKLYYIFDMGSDNWRELDVAVKYLPYLGTSRYTPEEIQKEFFRLGLKFGVSISKDQTYVFLQGLEENLEEGVKLFEHLLNDAKSQQKAFGHLVENILKKRKDEKSDKSVILREAMVNYAKYGKDSSFTYKLNREELESIDPASLTEIIRDLERFRHRIFYYGKKSSSEVKALLQNYHPRFDSWREYPPEKRFDEKDSLGKNVYFVNHDMVQSEMFLLNKGVKYEPLIIPDISLFNEYFGGGLSSIVYQEIRESKALAYSAYCYLNQPRYAHEHHLLVGYIGTQADKLGDALEAYEQLLDSMPKSDDQFNSAKESVLKKIESERISRVNKFWYYEEARKRGLDHDIREDIYNKLKNYSFSDLEEFYRNHVKNKDFCYLVLGKREKLDLDLLRSLGDFHELTLDQIFGY